MLYVFPIIFAVTGVNFPVGVLIYWSTTNLWTFGQQFYVIKRNPTPGSPAYEELTKKRELKNKGSDLPTTDEPGTTMVDPSVEQPRQRQQPSKKKKKKK